MNVRGRFVEMAAVDTEWREYGRIGAIPDASGNPMADIEIVVPQGVERVDIDAYHLYIDGIRWRGPMPAGPESYAHRENNDGVLIPSRMVFTVPLWMVDQIIEVIEQAANS